MLRVERNSKANGLMISIMDLVLFGMIRRVRRIRGSGIAENDMVVASSDTRMALCAEDTGITMSPSKPKEANGQAQNLKEPNEKVRVPGRCKLWILILRGFRRMLKKRHQKPAVYFENRFNIF